MKILVTGHEGFIGTALTKFLSKRHEVIGLDIKSGNDVLKCDLPEADLVIHLAGIGGVRESLSNPKRYWDNNVEGTRRILERYKRVRVLVAGSSSQYEPHLNPYAASKHVIEYIAHPNVCFMRFHTVYNESPRSGMFFAKLLNGTLEYTTTHERDFVYLDDVIRAIDILMVNDFIGPVDVGTGKTVRVCEIRPDLPVIKDTVGERLRTCADPTVMNALGWVPKVTVEEFLKEQNL